MTKMENVFDFEFVGEGAPPDTIAVNAWVNVLLFSFERSSLADYYFVAFGMKLSRNLITAHNKAIVVRE